MRSISQHGSTLLEVLLSIAVLAIIVTPIVGMVTVHTQNLIRAQQRVHAGYFAEEGLEASRSIRDADFSLLVDGVHGITRSSGVWEYSDEHDESGIYSRTITIAPLTDFIKEVVSTVTWSSSQGIEKSVSATTHFLDPAIANQIFINPVLASCVDLSGGQDALSVVRDGDVAYVITDSASESFVVLEFTPAGMTEVHRVNLQNNPRDLALSGDSVFIASKHNTQELQAIDVMQPAQSELVGSYDAPSASDAQSIVIKGQYAFLVRSAGQGAEFFILDIGNPQSPTFVSELELGVDATSIKLEGSLAYVGTDDASGEIKLIDISVPTAPVIVSVLDLSPDGRVTAIESNGDYLFVGQEHGDITVYSLADPLLPLYNDRYVVGVQINDLVYAPEFEALLVASSFTEGELLILDASTPYALVEAGLVDFSGAVYGVYYDPSDGSVMIASGANDQEVCLVNLSE
jgi:Tfp pilus assembly protein PilV